MAQDNSEITRTILNALGDPVAVFMAMNFITKACVAVALLAGVVALVLAGMRMAAGSERSPLLRFAGIAGLGFGAAGAAYDAFVTWQVASMLGETRLAVMAPSLVESAAALLVGVVVWLIAVIGNNGAKAA